MKKIFFGMSLRHQEQREIHRPSTFLSAKSIRWPTGKTLDTSTNIFLTKIYAVCRDSVDYEGILEKAVGNSEIIKTLISLIAHYDLR